MQPLDRLAAIRLGKIRMQFVVVHVVAVLLLKINHRRFMQADNSFASTVRFYFEHAVTNEVNADDLASVLFQKTHNVFLIHHASGFGFMKNAIQTPING